LLKETKAAEDVFPSHSTKDIEPEAEEMLRKRSRINSTGSTKSKKSITAEDAVRP
jgi:hypothetical protein